MTLIATQKYAYDILNDFINNNVNIEEIINNHDLFNISLYYTKYNQSINHYIAV